MSSMWIQTIVLVLMLLPWAWIGLAYAVACWHGRRKAQLDGATQGLLLSIMLIWVAFRGSRDPLFDLPWWILVPVIGVIVIHPWFVLWQRWTGRVVEPGYTHARELLLLHPPPVPTAPSADGSWHVPTNIVPDTRRPLRLFDWILLAITVLLVMMLMI